MLAQILTRPAISRRGTGTAAETYEILRVEATRLAGAPGDIVPRAAILHTLYLDSRGNHAFPEVALHGALWAHGALGLAAQAGGLLVCARHHGDERERAQRLRDLHAFLQGLKIVNRQVFIDTYVTYDFSRLCGDDPAARQLLSPPLLEALTEAHAATRAGRMLAPDRRRELFALALRHEQERTVTRGVREVSRAGSSQAAGIETARRCPNTVASAIKRSVRRLSPSIAAPYSCIAPSASPIVPLLLLGACPPP